MSAAPLDLLAHPCINQGKSITPGVHSKVKSQSPYHPPQNLPSHEDIRVEFTGKKTD
jgi:hypothetical protein